MRKCRPISADFWLPTDSSARNFRYCVPAQDGGRTVRALLLTRLCVSRGQLSRLKFNGGLWLDGQPVHSDVRVREGQTLEARFYNRAVLKEEARTAAIPQGMVVRFADEDLLIVEKPAPLPSVGSPKKDGSTLETAVRAYLGNPDRFIYRPVNRLDKGTSGLMAVALNAYAHQRMQSRLHTPAFVREYLAVTDGVPKMEEGVIDLPIAHKDGVRRYIAADGKPSRTRYKTIQVSGGHALLRLTLETGRTHQIRVHLSALGCPVTGDFLYGREDAALPGRFALHACRIVCRHPVSGETLAFDSPLPDGIERLLQRAEP